jgi:hypothetical protein
MSIGPSSSHPGDERQSVNPYAASQSLAPREHSHRHIDDRTPRHFRALMRWRDRRSFLKSVGPTRIAVVLAAVVTVKICYDLASDWVSYLWVEGFQFDLANVLGLLWAALIFTHCIVSIRFCIVDWQYAERLKEVAGGWRGDMADWSRLHYETAWLAALSTALSLASEVMAWIWTMSFQG